VAVFSGADSKVLLSRVLLCKSRLPWEAIRILDWRGLIHCSNWQLKLLGLTQGKALREA
jgi:hypothetical protein